MRSFSFTPRAVFVRSFSYTPRAVFVRSLSYTPRAVFVRSLSYSHIQSFTQTSQELFVIGMTRFWQLSALTLLDLILVRSFYYTPRAGFSEEFLLHSSS